MLWLPISVKAVTKGKPLFLFFTRKVGFKYSTTTFNLPVDEKHTLRLKFVKFGLKLVELVTRVPRDTLLG